MQTIYAIGSRYLDANNFHTQAKSLSILNYILKCEHNLWKLISWFMTVGANKESHSNLDTKDIICYYEYKYVHVYIVVLF